MRMRICLICNEMRGFGLDKQVWLENRDFFGLSKIPCPRSGTWGTRFCAWIQERQPVDTNRPGFQPLGCGSLCTQGFALGWYRSAPLALEARADHADHRLHLGLYASVPLALEAIRRVWIFGERHNFGFSQTDPLPILPHSTAL